VLNTEYFRKIPTKQYPTTVLILVMAETICPCFHTGSWLQHTFTALNRFIPVIITLWFIGRGRNW